MGPNPYPSEVFLDPHFPNKRKAKKHLNLPSEVIWCLRGFKQGVRLFFSTDPVDPVSALLAQVSSPQSTRIPKGNYTPAPCTQSLLS